MANAAVTTAEQAKAIPADQPLVVELPTTETAAPGAAAPPPDVPDLEKQLADLRKSEELARERAQLAERQREEALRQAELRASQAETTSRRSVDQANLDSIVNAINAAQTNLDRAKSDYAQARAASDFAAEADAQDRIADARSRLRVLESGKDELEQKIAQPPQPTQTQQPTDIDQIQGLLDSERQWLKQHPDAMMGVNLTRLQAAYYDATQKGLARGGEAYFNFLNDRLGYQTMTKEEPKPAEPAPQPHAAASGPRYAAPPSRDTGGTDSRSVTLTPAMRDAAKIAGIDEIEYAKQLTRMVQMKRDGFISN